MRRLHTVVLFAAASFFALAACQRKDVRHGERIFNGRDLAGWAGSLDAVEVKGDVLAWRTGKGGTIYWAHEVGDFQVQFRFKLPPGGNNGLAIHSPGTDDPAYVGLCELQILDENYEQVKNTRLDPRQRHGSAYGLVAARQGFQRAAGEWNLEQVTVRGSQVKVELNGAVILDTDLAKVDLATVLANKAHPGITRTRGFFGLAGHGDGVEFKDISLHEL